MHRFLLALLSAVLLFCGTLPVRAADAVASFALVADGHAQPERIVSFGQMFRDGTMPSGAAPSVTLNGAPAPAQLDAKAFYPDGSVRHGVLSVRVPAMAEGTTLQGAISAGAAAPVPATAYAAIPDLGFTLTTRPGTPKARMVHLSLAELAGKPTPDSPWLDGPLVREQRYTADIGDGLRIDFDVWTPVVGPSRVDLVFHNDSARNKDIDTRTYTVTVTLAGAPVFSAGPVYQYAHSTWHKLIFSDGQTPPRMVPDLKLLIDTGAVPRYAPVQPDAHAMDKLHGNATADAAPLSHAGLTTYMPTTGGRDDIGPLPAWAVFYLLDPSQENHQTLFANADGAGSVPWHVWDATTRGPISIDAHPDVWLDGRGKAVPGVMDRKFYISDTDWEPDDAHQPSLTYLPYLLTGSQYYRDELAMQAGYDLLAMDPEYRHGHEGYVLGSQVRAIAWDLRTIANAAFILPKGALQTYFQSKLENNLHNFIHRFIENRELKGAGELEGYLPGPYAVEGAAAPWMDNYAVMVLGWINTMGYGDAARIMDWMTNFVTGPFLNAHNGYDPIYGTAYYLIVQDHQSHLLDKWKTTFDYTFDPVGQPVKSLDYPDWGGGYSALARGALASIITATHSPEAAQAYGYVLAHTPELAANYPKDPVFAIMPVMPDGAQLALSDIHYPGDRTDIGDATAPGVVLSTTQDDKLTGGSGSDILYSEAGATIDGGAGDDYVFGGDGNNTLFVGPGADLLKGGYGVNNFILAKPSTGLPTILNFNPSRDRLTVSTALIEGGAPALPAKIAAASMEGGLLVVTFGPQARIAFRSLTAADLSALTAASTAN
jgi:hypothetical protein